MWVAGLFSIPEIHSVVGSWAGCRQSNCCSQEQLCRLGGSAVTYSKGCLHEYGAVSRCGTSLQPPCASTHWQGRGTAHPQDGQSHLFTPYHTSSEVT